MLRKIKSWFSPDHPLRLFVHKIKALLACLVYRYPANNLTVIGITGTNGKTTTVNLTAKILEKAGLEVGMASTTNFKMGKKEWQNKTHKTTLGPFQIQRLLRKMVKAGVTHVVIETSSHALAQYRVYGIPYDVVCFTNVTPEHLDYHRSMKAYRMEKGKLFDGLMKGKRKKGVEKVAILNADDPDNYEYFSQFPAEKKISYGINQVPDATLFAHVTAKDIDMKQEQTDLTLVTPEEQGKVKLFLPGEFNIENLLAASTIGFSLGTKLADVRAACEEVKLIPGRMETIEEGQDFTVYVDFAMTEDGYEKLLKTLRKTTEGKIWVVFGCCGDRDRKKRPVIGEICGEMADKVVVCDDEPYTEDPKVIREMILDGLHNTSMKRNTDFWEIPDRTEAIEFACKNAEAGDTVVIPGMGDFEGRTFADGIHPWNEREEVRKVLQKLRGVGAEETHETVN